MDEKIWKAALAGLLHDVGKLEQRAQLDPWRTAPGIEREGQPVHATWTSFFIDQYVPQPYRAAAYAGAYHHQPDKSPAADKTLSNLVALADKLSAGERADLEETTKHPPRQMVTIFDRISLHEQHKQEGWHYLPLNELSLRESALFPQPEMQSSPEGKAYDVLCEKLRKTARMEILEPEGYLENLLAAFQRYTWCVPSAYYHSIPDISIYDHSRMTAALAVCLTSLPSSEIDQLLVAVERDFTKQAQPQDEQVLANPVAYLLGCDISGIQKFIYTISSRGAARTLRGRSFYLQILTEAVLRFVLKELGLPYANVIYSGGGHFYLLAPADSALSLERIHRLVTQKILRHHGTSLYLAMGWQAVPASGFKKGHFAEYWSKMHQALARSKSQRYLELENDELFTRIFKPPDYGGNPETTCAVCGEDSRTVNEWNDDEPQSGNICALCKSFEEEIGNLLPRASFLALGLKEPEELDPGTARAALKEFGLDFEFLENENQVVQIPGARQVVLWALDDPQEDRWPSSDRMPAVRWLHYVVNQVPRGTFNDLQKKVEGGFKRLGVLRMDVDNLGEIFSLGFGEAASPERIATLARLSTLSLQMSIFFEGWVKAICERFPELVYAVYSGGDDLFLITPWDVMPRLALEIRHDFSRYTAAHPAMHLSGGMAMIGGKYPVYQAARDAEEVEKMAKDIPGKNAFTFLNHAWTWLEFEQVIEKKNRLYRLVASGKKDPEGLGGPESILQTLRQLALQEEQAARVRGRPVYGPWLWIGPYQLTRLAEQYEKKKPALHQALIDLRDSLSKNRYEDISQWGAAARWVQLEIRKKMNKENDKEVFND